MQACGNPQRVTLIRKHGADRIVRKPIFRSERSEAAFPVLRQAVGCADPKRPSLVAVSAVIEFAATGVFLIEEYEFVAIEAANLSTVPIQRWLCARIRKGQHSTRPF